MRATNATMLRLPDRGDQIAKRWVLGGLIAYVILAATFVVTLLIAEGRQHQPLSTALLQLFGIGRSTNFTTLVLVVGGVLITLVSMLKVRSDIRLLTVEELDVEWVRDHERPGLLYVFLDPHKREQRFREDRKNEAAGIAFELPEPHSEGARVESLIDDRVRKVQRAASSRDTFSLSPEEFRIIAEKRTAMLGGLARYSTGMLMLMAVLGTFAGVKTALPSLIGVFQSAAGAAMSDPSAIAGPLQLVADAFGGNALALIGAIALGIMAQGLAFGRQSFLERLELVSVEHIYRVNDAEGGSPLELAMRNLSTAADGLRGSNSALANISVGLTTLGDEFRTQISKLDDRLAKVASDHESTLYTENARVLGALNGRLAELADGVKASAGVYAGLVSRLDQHANQSKSAVDALAATNALLGQAISASSTMSGEGRDVIRLLAGQGERIEQGAQGVEAQLTALNSSLERQLEVMTKTASTQLASLASAVNEAGPTLRQLDSSLEVLANKMERSHSETEKRWLDAVLQSTSSLDKASQAVQKAIAESAAQARVARVPATVGGGSWDPSISDALFRIGERGAKQDRLMTIVLGAGALGVLANVIRYFLQ